MGLILTFEEQKRELSFKYICAIIIRKHTRTHRPAKVEYKGSNEMKIT